MKLRKKMQLELKRIQQEVGITFIYVTHDQEEAMTMSNRLAVMRQGRIEQLGEPEFVYENPATEFVAGFLGASNLLDGSVSSTDAGISTVALDDGGSVKLPSSRLPSDANGAIRVGVRPEKLSITRGDGPAPAGMNGVAGTVTMTTYIGVSHQYKVEAPGGHTLTVYVQNLGADEAPRQGEHVVLSWDPEHTFAVTPQEGLQLEEDEE
jgi:spermidine/putrescine transport system ATP-binding protein